MDSDFIPVQPTEPPRAADSFNLYCDESCHLENDGQKAMVLGTLIVSEGKHLSLAEELKALKRAHGIHHAIEVKWGAISPAKLEFYLALIDWFFDEPALRFRALVVPDKTILNHHQFNQTHDDFYYKCWYQAIIPLLSRKSTFNVYLDKKDTRWAAAGFVDTGLSFFSLLELYGTDVPERRMPARRVVEALDVVEHV